MKPFLTIEQQLSLLEERGLVIVDRDNASIEELLVINNIQLLNSEMIKKNIDSPTRLKELNRIAQEQYQTLIANNQKALQDLKKLDAK